MTDLVTGGGRIGRIVAFTLAALLVTGGLAWAVTDGPIGGGELFEQTSGLGLRSEIYQPPGSISGRVTTDAGAPLEDICVKSYDSDLTVSGYDETDSDGRYLLSGMPGGEYKLKFYDCGDNSVAREFYNDKPDVESADPVTVVPESVTQNIDIHMTVLGSISGTIRNTSNQPLTGICANTFDTSGKFTGYDRTDSNGNYKVGGLAAGDYRVRFLDCEDNNVLPEYFDDRPDPESAVPVTVTTGSNTANVDAQLATGGSIAGTVTDSSDDPIEDVCVRAYDATGKVSGSATTDAGGNYLIGRLVTGAYQLRFTDCGDQNFLSEFYDDKQDLGSATPISVTAGSVTSDIDAQLATGGSISGTVNDDSGNALADICVTAYTADGDYVSEKRTGPDGSYRIPGLSTGGYRLHFQDCGDNNVLDEYYDNKQSFGAATLVAVTAGFEQPDIDAILTKAGSISGVVTNSFGIPLSRVCVTAYDSDGNWFNYARTTSDGSYALGRLTQGDYRLNFSDCGDNNVVGEYYLDKQTLDEATPVSVSLGLTTPAIDAELATGGSITGRITDQSDQPLRGVCVRAFNSGGSRVASVSTDSQGVYAVGGLTGGNYRLRFLDCGDNNILSEYYDGGSRLSEATPIAVELGSATANIDAKLTRAGSISGRVMNSSGSPLDDICVYSYSSDNSSSGSGRTRSDGTYRVLGLKGGDHRLEFADCGQNNVLGEYFDDQASLSSATPISVTLGAETTDKNAQLASGGSISGVVTSESGDPLRQICVRVYRPNGSRVGKARTDIGGRYKVSGLVSGSYRVGFTDCGGNNVLGEYYDDKPSIGTATPVSVVAGSDTAGIDARLARAGSISGTVTDSSGALLADVCVTAYDASGDYASNSYTGWNGEYQLNGLTTGDYRVRFSDCGDNNVIGEYYDDASDWEEATTVPVANGSDTSGIDAELARAGSISGIVTDSSGEPLETICVYAYGTDGAGWGYDYTESDGTYRIRGLKPGSYRVQFEDCGGNGVIDEYYEDKQDWDEATLVPVTSGTEVNINASLASLGSISGTVTDNSGVPLEGICVYAYQGWDFAGSDLTGEDGSYRIKGLETGEYGLRFTDCGDNDAIEEFYDDKTDLFSATPVAVTTGVDTAGIDAEMLRAASISGTVTDDSNQPLEDVCIGAWGEATGSFQSAVTGVDGKYRIRGLLEDDYRIGFFDCGDNGLTSEYYDDAQNWEDATLVSIASGQAATGIDAQLATGGSITGLVTDASGDPIEDVCATAYDSNGNYVSGVSSAADGTYRIPRLLTGDYLIQFSDCGDSNVVTEYYDDVTDWQSATPVSVETGVETPGIDAVLAQLGSISGTVTDRSGVPLEDICVTAYDSNGSYIESIYSQSDGSYRLRGLDDGSYRLEFSDCGNNGVLGEFYDDAVDLASATPVSVTTGADSAGINARLTRKGSITGVVTAGSGAPLSDICVQAYNSSGYSAGSTRSAADGSYSLAGLSDGNYRLRFSDCGGNGVLAEYYDDKLNLNSATPISVTAGTVTSGIDAQLTQGGVISGTVTDDSAQPLEEMCVRAYDSEGDQAGVDWSGEDGTYRILGLPTGDYKVMFSDCGDQNVRSEYYDDANDFESATSISVVSGSEIEGIDASLVRLGSISGTVTNSSNQPLANVCVYAYDQSGGYASTGYTDADGQYRVPGLVTGEYRIQFYDCGSNNVVSEYYDDKPDLDSATTVSVSTGSDTTGIDAQLTFKGSISGVVTNGSGALLSGICVGAYDSSGSSVGWTSTGADGAYRVNGLVGGSYRLLFFDCSYSHDVAGEYYDDKPNLASATAVSVVVGVDTGGINAQLDAPGSISGRVTDLTGNPLSNVCVSVLDPSGQSVTYAYTNSSGSYSIGSLTPWNYRVRFEDCGGHDVIPEYFDDKPNFATSDPVTVTTGNVTDDIDAQMAYYDRIPPDTTIDSGPPARSTQTSPTFTYSGHPASDVHHFECRIVWWTSFQNCPAEGGAISDLWDGTWTFEVRAVDAAGNIDPTPAAQTFEIDTTPPQTTIAVGPPAFTNQATASFQFESTEPDSTFECSLDGAQFTSCEEQTDFPGLPAGDHELKVRAADALGNVDQTPAVRQWNVDLTPPTTTILSGPTGLINDRSPSFSFASDDPHAKFECRLDTDEFVDCGSNHTFSSVPDGAHVMEVRARDRGGNVDLSPAQREFSVDATPPETTILSGPTGAITGVSATFTYAGTPPEDVDHFECRLDTASYATCSNLGRTYTGIGDGDHVFQVRAVDALGNRDLTPASREFSVESRPPETTITGGPGSLISSTEAGFTFESNEPGSTFQCKLDAGSYETCSSPKLYTGLAEGNHAFQVRAIDPAGNVDPSPDVYEFWVDVTPPDTSILEGPSGTVTTTAATFSYEGTSGTTRFVCRIDGGSWGNCSVSGKQYNQLEEGSHTFEVSAVDAAGNVDLTPASRTWTISLAGDVTPPETTIVSSPPAIKLRPSEVSFSFTSSEADSTFRCQIDDGPIETCSSSWSPSGLTHGVHVFKVAAVDPAGNLDPTPDSRSFTVDTIRPQATLELSTTSGPAPLETTATFTGSDAGGDALQYQVHWGDGAYTSGSIPHGPISHTYERAGVYKATVLVTDSRYQAVATQDVVVGLSEPLKAVAGDDLVATEDTPVKFDGKGSRPQVGIEHYDWDFGDGGTAIGSTPTHVFTEPGTYDVDLTVRYRDESSVDTAQVTVLEESAPRLDATVKTGGSPLQGADVAVVDSDGSRFSATTDSSGKATIRGLPDGEYTVYAWRQGYRAISLPATMKNGEGTVEFNLESGEVVAAETTSRRLDLQEIIDLGIDVNDPENQNVYEFEVNLGFEEEVGLRGYLVGGGGGGGGGGGSGSFDPLRIEYRGEDGAWYPCVGDDCIPGWTPTFESVEGKPLLVWLKIPGEASFLKEFFSIDMVVQNLAGEGVTLEQGSASLLLPSGLSLAPTSTPQTLTKSMPDIPAGGSATASWIVRGDKEGEYRPNTSYSAMLEPFSAPVSILSQLRDPLKVWGGSALKMIVKPEDRVDKYRPYRVAVGLQNVSDVPVYNPTVELKREGKLNFIYQPRERLRQGTSVVQPGSTFWTDDYILVPAITGKLRPEYSFVKKTAGTVDLEDVITPVPQAPVADITTRGAKNRMIIDFQAIDGADSYEIYSAKKDLLQDFPDQALDVRWLGETKAMVPVPPGTDDQVYAVSTVGSDGVHTMWHPAVQAEDTGRWHSPTAKLDMSGACTSSQTSLTFNFDEYDFELRKAHIEIEGLPDANPDISSTGKYGPIDVTIPPDGLKVKAWATNDEQEADGNGEHGPILEKRIGRCGYVALGDSYSSGEGAPSDDHGSGYEEGTDEANTNTCHRSPKAYPQLVADHFGSSRSFTFRACSGAVTDDVWTSPQSFDNGDPYELNGEPEGIQLKHINRNTELVTISIGGNDAKFAPIVTDCIKKGAVAQTTTPVGVAVSQFLPACKPKWAESAERSLEEMADKLPRLYKTIKDEMAPNGKLVVMPYPDLFPASGNFCWGISPADIRWLHQMEDQLNEVIRQSAKGLAVVADLSEFEGHDACKATGGWINGPRLPVVHSFHPNIEGQRQMSLAAIDAINADLPGDRADIDMGETLRHEVDVAADTQTAVFSTDWQGSTVQTTLISPSGRRITPDTRHADVQRFTGETWEVLRVDKPEPGQWEVELHGTDIPEGGEEVVFDSELIAAENKAPSAVFEASRTKGDPPQLHVEFDGSGSFDVDGEITNYEWDFGDGSTASGAQVEHTFTGPGSFRPKLTVTDNEGETNSYDGELIVVSRSPVAVDDSFRVAAGGELHRAAPGVLANDIDPESTEISAVTVTPAEHGQIELEPDGGISYEPDPGFSGTETLEYEIVNAYGAVSEPGTITIRVKDLYGTQIDGGPQGTVASNSATFTYSASPEAGIGRFECRLDEDAAGFSMCPGNGITYSSLGDGEHRFEVRVIDGDGDPDPAPATRTFKVDTTPPETVIAAGPPGVIAANSATFEFAGSPVDDTAKVQCRIDSQAFADCVSPKTFSGLADGSHTVEFRAEDAVGNKDQSVASRTFTVDTTPPDTVISGGPTGTIASSSATFNFGGTPAEDTAKVQCRIDSGTFGDCVSPKTFTALADGSHTVEFRAEDAVGNKDQSVASRTFTVDTTPPDTVISGGPSGLITSNSATFTFAGSPANDTAKVQCRIDAGAFEDCVSPKTFTALADGPHTVEFRAEDAAGNKDQSPASRAFTVDTTPPDTTSPDTVISSGPDGVIKTNSATFEFAGSPANDTAKVQCRIDGGAFADCVSPKTFSGLADGSHTVEFRAEDAAGNQDQSPASRTFSVDTAVIPNPVAVIGKVTVSGPAKVKKRRTGLYKVTISNTGDASATGVRLKATGKGVSASANVGTIAAGSSRKVSIKLKPKKPGKVKVSFKVTSGNAGGKTATKTITVKK